MNKNLLKKYNKWLDIIAAEKMDSNGQLNTIISCIKSLPEDYKSALCIGCGDGTELNEFEKLKKEAIGTTLNNFTEDERVVEMDMHDMGFDNNSFDLVFAKDVFEHSISHIMALSEYARVTRKYVFIALPNIDDWSESAHHFIIPNEKQLKSLARKVGLDFIGYLKIDHLDCYLFEKKGKY